MGNWTTESIGNSYISLFIHIDALSRRSILASLYSTRGGAYRGKCLLNGGVILFLRTIFENNSWKLSVNVISFSNRNRADPFEGIVSSGKG